MEENRQPDTYSRLVQVEKEIAVVHSSVKSLDDHLKQTNQSLKELTEAFREHVLESMHRQENRIIIVEQDLKYFRAIVDEQRALIADMEKRQKEDDKARTQFGAIMAFIGFLGTSAGGAVLKLLVGGG